MKRFITLLSFMGFFLLGSVIINDLHAQEVKELKSSVGRLVRIAPKLSEIDRNSMNGKPFVITRNEKGLIARQTPENIAAKQAFLEQISQRVGESKPTEPTPVAENSITRNVPTTGINYNADGITATGFAPSDNNMAVGPNHIIQIINHSSGSAFTIRTKTGTVVQGSTILASLTGQTGGGDPIVLYDALAGRWFLSEFDAVGANGGAVNIAVSSSSDPVTSTWAVYRYTDVAFFPDYPKYSVWHNAYYLSTQDFAPSFVGSSIWAFDRAAMLAAAPTATMVRVRLNLSAATTTWGICAVSMEGTTPSNQSGFFAYNRDNNLAPATPADSVGLIQFTPNFTTPASSVVSPSEKFASLPFDLGNGSAPTPGGGSIGTLAGKTMFKPTYRNFGTHESIVMCVTANAGGGRAGIKWWELRRTGGAGPWSIYQEGLYAPADAIHRFMPSITISSNGNIAILYNASSAAVQGSLRYTARNECDPLGQMTLAEQIVVNGSANNPSGARYGDYNSLELDPSTPNSFWGTGQYSTSAFGTFQNWGTRIVNFTVGGGCAPTPTIIADGYTLVSESCVPANGFIDPGETVTVSFCLRNSGTAAASNVVGTLQTTGGIITPSGPQNYGLMNPGDQVCRDFTFTNSSATCGGTITPTIQVQDGASNLGLANFGSITLGTTVNVLVENFDAVVAPALPAGWSTTATGAGAALWTTSATTPFSAPNAAFVPNPASISDNILESASFVPGALARLTFSHNHAFETGSFDGGVLEISINGGAYQDIITAGGSFVSGGYTGTISSSFSNPLGGRAAWVNSSGGYIITVVALPNAASGQPTRIRFREGTDVSLSATGWRVDNVVIGQPSCCGAPCVLTCPANITTGATAGLCGANVTYPAATTTGLCGPVTYSRASGSFFPVGTTTVNVSTASGATCSFTITVTDNVPPTITCPANITVPNNAGVCSAVVNYALPSVVDNCPLPGTVAISQNTNNTTITTNTGISCGAGATQWWRSYNLASFPAITGAFTIRTVRFGVEVNNTGVGQTITANVYRQTGAAFPGGTRTLIGSGTVAITAAAGTFYTVNLTAPPTVANTDVIVVEVSCPVGGVFPAANALGESGPTYISSTPCGVPNPVTLASLGFTANHNIIDIGGTIPVVPPVLTQTAGLPSGSVFPVGTTTNSFTARDAVGNTSTCSFTVTVTDSEQPTISCPANKAITTQPGVCYGLVTNAADLTPIFADNCGVTRLTWTLSGATTGASPASGINLVPTTTQFGLTGRTGVGVTTVTYTAADAAGNTRTCSFTVTVSDASIPVISAQPATKFVCVGSNAVFSVTATAGTGNPLTYQWQQWTGSAWADITGATASSYTIPSVTFAQNTNSYRVILTGRCSDVTSSFATLYVNPLPTVTVVTSIPPALLPGQSLNISSTVSLAGGTYSWLKNGSPIGTPLSQGPVLSNLTVDDIGTYRLVYTDPNGCVGTSADVVITGLASENLWVYPVPNNGTFQVRFFNTANENATLRVIDEKGSKVYERAVVTGLAYTRIDVVLPPAIADGSYLVELVNSAGKRVGVKKIIVRKKP
jgi:HYR domain